MVCTIIVLLGKNTPLTLSVYEIALFQARLSPELDSDFLEGEEHNPHLIFNKYCWTENENGVGTWGVYVWRWVLFAWLAQGCPTQEGNICARALRQGQTEQDGWGAGSKEERRPMRRKWVSDFWLSVHEPV